MKPVQEEMDRVPKDTINNHVISNRNYSDQLLVECLQRDGRFIMSSFCFFLCFSFSLLTLPQSCGGVPVAVQTKGDCLWEQSVCGALVCTTTHWFAIRIIGEVVWVLDSLHCSPRLLGIRGDAAIAQFFDENKFAFPVCASSIGHGQKVVQKFSRSNKSPPKVPMFSW